MTPGTVAARRWLSVLELGARVGRRKMKLGLGL